MKYFLDAENNRWSFEDNTSQLTIDNAAADHGVTLTRVSEAVFTAAFVVPFPKLQMSKINDIEIAFAAAELLPVTSLGIDWNSGYDAVAKYKVGYDLSDLEGLDSVDFKDISNVRHTLSLADAKVVLIAIGADYLNKDAIRDDYLAQARSASTQVELDAITISFN